MNSISEPTVTVLYSGFRLDSIWSETCTIYHSRTVKMQQFEKSSAKQQINCAKLKIKLHVRLSRCFFDGFFQFENTSRLESRYSQASSTPSSEPSTPIFQSILWYLSSTRNFLKSAMISLIYPNNGGYHLMRVWYKVYRWRWPLEATEDTGVGRDRLILPL